MYSFFTDLAEKVPTGYFYALSGGSPLQLCRVLNHHNRNKKGKEGKLRIFFIFMLKNRSNHVKVFVVKKTNVFEGKTDDDDRRNLCIHWMK